MLLCIAALLRFSYLGDADFGLDEILHATVAEQLIQGNPPVLPSGYVYDRSLSFSYFVAFAGLMGGISEYSLRLPAAIFGVLLVLFVYWVTARWFSASAGLVAAFLVTFSPIEVALSREVRMYTLLQLLFLLILFLFYEGFETSPHVKKRNGSFSRISEWVANLQIRPIFLVGASLLFLLAWEIHKLIQPGIAGIFVYILVMGSGALFVGNLAAPKRLKYVGSALCLIVGAVVGSVLFPEKIEEFIATTQAVPPWYQERAGNWNFYRWQLLDEYPIVFGSLAIPVVFCFIRNAKLSLFLALSFIIPFILHSVFFPQKSYRYIHHILPIMYIIAGVGFGEVFSFLWSAGQKLNSGDYFSRRIWTVFVAGILSVAIVALLMNMPWFKRTVKDFSTHFQSPHFTDVQHHNWNNVMTYISEHQKEGDVMISSYPLLASYYGATQPLYFMNDAYDSNNQEANIRDAGGRLLDYTFGGIVLRTLEDFKHVIHDNHSGWIVTYRWRGEGSSRHRSRPIPIVGTFPHDVVMYLNEHFTLEPVPHSSDMAVWRWSRADGISAVFPKSDSGRSVE